MNSYRIVPEKGSDWPTSIRKIHSCIVCRHAVLAESDAFWVVNEYLGASGTMRLTCSEECANMFILQDMGRDTYDDVISALSDQIREGIDRKIIAELFEIAKKGDIV